MVSLSCIIPAYNEESVEEVVSGLRRVLDGLIEYEIIVVDDGSAKPLVIPSVTVVRHDRNMGYGSALKSGMLKARGDRVLIVDSDCSYPLASIPNLLKVDADMVVGARSAYNRNIPLSRKPAKMFLGLLANYLSGVKIPDLNSGLRVFDRRMAMEFFHLYPRGFSFTTTITLAFLSSDYSVEYVPIDYCPRKGRSKISPIKDGLGFTLLIVRTILYFNPLKVFLPISALMMLAALALFAYTALVQGRVMDISVVTLSLSAVQVALVGLLADLIVKRAR
jgi:glycosyltransferase involved in cell wall biosynthesis